MPMFMQKPLLSRLMQKLAIRARRERRTPLPSTLRGRRCRRQSEQVDDLTEETFKRLIITRHVYIRQLTRQRRLHSAVLPARRMEV